MDAKACIIASFKRLLESTPYAKITVADVCRDAHLSRKSFYAHFTDKEAIVREEFDAHVIKPLENFNELFSLKEAGNLSSLIQEKIYANVAQERAYYENLIRPMRGSDDTFIRVATNGIYDFNMKMFAVLGTRVPALEADYAAYFFAASQAMLIQKWVSDGMPLSPKELAQLYLKMTRSFWDGYHSKLPS